MEERLLENKLVVNSFCMTTMPCQHSTNLGRKTMPQIRDLIQKGEVSVVVEECGGVLGTTMSMSLEDILNHT